MKVLTIIFLGILVTISSCGTDTQTEKSVNVKHTKTETKSKEKNKSKNQGSTIAKNIKLSDFDQIMANKKPLLVDVRTAQEFASGHIDGAINIDVMTPEFKSEMAKLNAKDKPVMLYCRSGNRSGRAMKTLNREGYSELYNLMGGYMAYSKR